MTTFLQNQKGESNLKKSIHGEDGSVNIYVHCEKGTSYIEVKKCFYR